MFGNVKHRCLLLSATALLVCLFTSTIASGTIAYATPGDENYGTVTIIDEPGDEPIVMNLNASGADAGAAGWSWNSASKTLTLSDNLTSVIIDLNKPAAPKTLSIKYLKDLIIEERISIEASTAAAVTIVGSGCEGATLTAGALIGKCTLTITDVNLELTTCTGPDSGKLSSATGDINILESSVSVSGHVTAAGKIRIANSTVTDSTGAVVSAEKPKPTPAQLDYTFPTPTYNGNELPFAVAAKSHVAPMIGVISVFYNGVAAVPSYAGTYEITVNITEGVEYASVQGLSLGYYKILPKPVPPPPQKVTTPDKPPAKPSITKLSVGKRSVKVTWKKQDSAKKVTKIEVRYKVKGVKKWKVKKISKGTTTSLTIKSLKKGNKYSCAVRAYNVRGWSAWSSTKSSGKVK